MLHMTASSPSLGSMNLSGNLTRQVEQDHPLESPASHIPNIGRMIEDQEIKIRNSLQEVYFGKCKDIVNDLRSIEKVSILTGDRKVHGLVVESLAGAKR
jgi:capping protein (actin filament) muscle Z-line, beta